MFLLADRPKMAFSFASGLNGNLGPLSSDTILVFRKEITNIGNAFSKITGNCTVISETLIGLSGLVLLSGGVETLY